MFFRYKLLMDNLLSLREDMKLLYRNGYGWPHPFTQCILKQRLKMIKYNTPIDISICNPFLRMPDDRQVCNFRLNKLSIYMYMYVFTYLFIN